ncbi:MAG TPA: putative metallopeptidase [Bacillota bacterium]|jgi:predicted metallopeptidase
MPDYQPAELYEDIARALYERMPELRHAPVGSIAFVENTAKKSVSTRRVSLAKLLSRPKKKVTKYATTRKLSPLIQWMTNKSYVIEIFQDAVESFSREQRILLVYHQLKHIASDGSLAKHDVEEWGQVAAAIGADWATTQRVLPDLLSPDFDWSRARGPQMTIGEVIEDLKAEGVTLTVEPGPAAAAPAEAPADPEPPEAPEVPADRPRRRERDHKWQSASGMGIKGLVPRPAVGDVAGGGSA